MPFTVTAVLLLCAGAFVCYLLGSVNSALIFTRIFMHRDVREMGSGNAGMTNAFRTGGKVVGVLTLLGDLLKVFLSVWFGRLLLFPFIQSLAPQDLKSIFHPMLAAFFCGFFAFIGHIYPVFFGFKGGKGVLTALGTVLMVDWRLVIPTLGMFFLILFLTKYVSVSSMIAAVMYPTATFFLYDPIHKNMEPGFQFGFLSLRLTETVIASLFAILILFHHRANIGRLMRGEEHKIGQKKKEE